MRAGETLLDEMRRVQRKAWELLSKTESEGDHRGAIVAHREVRGCLESLGDMLAKADTVTGELSVDEADPIIKSFVLELERLRALEKSERA